MAYQDEVRGVVAVYERWTEQDAARTCETLPKAGTQDIADNFRSVPREYRQG